MLHPCRPTVNAEKRWGYYWRDPAGKKHVRLKNPHTGYTFETKAERDAFLHDERNRAASGSSVTIGQIAEHLFDAEGEWARQRARERGGRPLSAGTLREHRSNVRIYIIPGLGNQKVVDIDLYMIKQWAFSDAVDISNAHRRNLFVTLRCILEEACLRRIIKAVPLFPRLSKGSSKPSIPTRGELDRLFPVDPKELRRVWRCKDDNGDEGIVFAACLACVFFAGARPQEARAVHPGRLLQDIWALLITSEMTGEGKRAEYVKMATENDPRYRVSFLFLQGPQIMKEWLAIRPQDPEWLFTYRGAPILKGRLWERLKTAIKNAGIETEGRSFKPYSGRYCFETVVKPAVSRELLKMMMGHISDIMPEHYDVPVLIERAYDLAPAREEANKRLLIGRG